MRSGSAMQVRRRGTGQGGGYTGAPRGRHDVNAAALRVCRRAAATESRTLLRPVFQLLFQSLDLVAELVDLLLEVLGGRHERLGLRGSPRGDWRRARRFRP